ncbi:MAG: hypothetical protein L0312_06745, partial [Acidobacteria bacterium]|nr:hypothetical protein [Acidobacteriota bacterium]
MIHPRTRGLAARPALLGLFLSAALLLGLGVRHVYRRLDAATPQQKPTAGSPQERLLYHNNIAIALMEQFNFREALAELARCLKADSKFLPAFVNSGLSHFYLQEFPQAEQFLKKAVALNS